MNFLLAAALGVGVLVFAPLVAHLLRRGRTPERVFPPAALVGRLEAHSKERARLEDRTLLSLRAAMVVVLAVLGATPLVQCSRLSVDRPHGASVALALIIDDSHSMRAEVKAGRTRWDEAILGARQLMRSMREGDAVAIVLSGKPARLALSGTTDLKTARAALEELHQTDRSSDLDAALELARSSVKNLQQPDRKLVVLSDLAGSVLAAPDASAPLESLRQPIDDCGLLVARRQNDRLSVSMACSKAASAARGLHVIAAAPIESILSEPARLTRLSLAPRPGTQALSFGLLANAPDFEIELTPGDANAKNDRVHVSSEGAQLNVAVVTDASHASVITGGPTVIEQALLAVRSDASLRPLSMLPDETKELETYAALVLNDPTGLGPETRAALGQWIEHGGVALGLLGPASSNLSLSATLEPFAERGARWEANRVALDVDAASVEWLGQDARSLRALTRGGRMRLDGAGLPGSASAGTWQDGVPFLLRRPLGSGLVLSAGLPASVEYSDFALRPVFLALLEHVVSEAEQRRGPGITLVGEPWIFPADKQVRIEGPLGPLAVSAEGCESDGNPAPNCAPGQQSATPELAGRYTIFSDGGQQTRSARIDDHEISDAPGSAEPSTATAAGAGESGAIDASPELALALLGFFAGELVLRLGSEARRRRRAARALS